MQLPSVSDQVSFNPKGKRILFISAHPDDADFGAGGTALTWLRAGAKAAIVICTNGDKGSDNETLSSADLANLRHKEQLAASKYLGLDHTWFLNYPDAHLEISQQLKNQLVRIIREYKPDVVFTFDPTNVYSLARNSINHPDHRAVGQATLDAVFPMARDFLTFPEHKAFGLAPHKVSDIFLYNFEKANFFVDITPVFDDKLQLLALHKSQVDTAKLRPMIAAWATTMGETAGVPYAEGFVHLQIQ